MTEQTEGAEVLSKAERDLIIDTGRHVYGCCADDCPSHGLPEDAQIAAVARIIAAREAAAEARGAQAVLTAVEAELTGEEERLAPYGPDASGLLGNWLGGIGVARDAARAAAAAAGGGGEGRVRDCPQHGSDDCRHMAEGIVVDLRALRQQIAAAQAEAWERGWADAQRSHWTAPLPEDNPYRAALVAPSRVPGEGS